MRDSSTTPDKETVRITRCEVGMNEQILNDFFNTRRNPQAMPVFGKFSKLLSGILPFHEKKVFKKISLFFSNFPALFCIKFKKKSIYHAGKQFPHSLFMGEYMHEYYPPELLKEW